MTGVVEVFLQHDSDAFLRLLSRDSQVAILCSCSSYFSLAFPHLLSTYDWDKYDDASLYCRNLSKSLSILCRYAPLHRLHALKIPWQELNKYLILEIHNGGNIQVIRDLVKLGARVGLPLPYTAFPIKSAVEFRNFPSNKPVKLYNILKRLHESCRYWHTDWELLHEFFKEGLTPLHLAAAHGNLECVTYLLSQDADPRLASIRGHTPLDVAARHGHEEIVKALLIHSTHESCNSSTLVTLGKMGISSGGTLLHNLISNPQVLPSNSLVSFFEALVGVGEIVNALDTEENTPLHLAVKSGSEELVLKLLELGACVEMPNYYGRTALHVGVTEGVEIGILECLLKWNSNVNGVSLLMPSDGDTPLHYAAKRGDVRSAEFLVSNGAGLQTRNSERESPALSAVKNGHLPMVEFLASKGCVMDGEKYLLHFAAAGGSELMVSWAIEHGFAVDVNLENEDGQTALHLAARRGNVRVAELLVERGARIDMLNSRKNTPLHIAAASKHYDMAKYLVENGSASLLVRNASYHYPVHEAILAEAPELVGLLAGRAKDCGAEYNGQSVLQLALVIQNKDVVKALLDKGDWTGITPLHIAVEHKYVDGIRMLVKAGVGLELRCGFEGNTTLHLAAKRGEVEIVKLLLDAGSDVNAVNSYGMTPVQHAEANNNIEVVKLLMSRGAEWKAANVRQAKLDMTAVLMEWGGDFSQVREEMEGFYAAMKGELRKVRAAVFGSRMPALAAAVFRGDLQMAKEIVQMAKVLEDQLYLKVFTETLLHIAVRRRHVEMLKYLLDVEGGAWTKVNKKNWNGYTPLHLATMFEDEKTDHMLEVLVSKGANLEARSNDWETPLHVAIKQENVAAVRWLLVKGRANARARTKRGKYPVHLVNEWQKGVSPRREEIVTLLTNWQPY